ncbi:MAG: hypothetical protein IIA92_05110 [Chloroflexi bacterium]|nr:hypothetical protein [Chloroflexota bacterium]
MAKRLNSTVRFSLEDALDFISSDELVEITHQNFRMRKRELTNLDRAKKRRVRSKQRRNTRPCFMLSSTLSRLQQTMTSPGYSPRK